MAKGSSLKLSELKLKCLALDLNPTPTRNRVNKDTGERYKDFSKDDYMKALQEYYISKYKLDGTYHHSLDWILKMDSPMLALQIKNLPKETQDEIWNNDDNWIAEEKIDGCRLNLCWLHSDRCLDAFSRNTSVHDFLPINYGKKLYDNVNTSLLEGFPDFIIDGELVLMSKNINKGDGSIVADTQLNMVSAILSADYELSKEYQYYNPIKLVAFDIMMYDDNDLTGLPLRDRRKYLELVYDKLKSMIHIELVPNGKGLTTKQFYEQVVSVGGEGLVVKNLNSLYDIKGKRAGEWVKIKRTVTGSLVEAKLGDTLDAFVIGFTRGNGKNRNLVGSITFGVYLLDKDNNVLLDNSGAPIIHVIAQVGGLDDALRENITVYDPVNDIVQLRSDVYGMVAVVSGQDISSKQMRIVHPVLKYWRNDKTPEQCSIREDFLEKLVL